MSDVLGGSIGVFRRAATADGLARWLGQGDGQSVTMAAEVAVPLLVQAVRHRLGEPDGGGHLADLLTEFDPADLEDSAEVFESGRFGPPGLALADHLLVDAAARDHAARTVSDQAGLGLDAGVGLVAAAAWVVGNVLRDEAGPSLDRQSLLAAVEERTIPTAPQPPVSSLAPIVPSAPSEPSVPAEPSEPGERRDLDSRFATAATAAAAADQPETAPADAPAQVAASAMVDNDPLPASRIPPHEPRSLTDDDINVGSSGLVTGVAIVLGLMVAGLGLSLWLDSRSDGSPTSAELAEAGADGSADDGSPDDGEAASPSAEDTDAETGDTADDEDAGYGTADDDADSEGDDAAEGEAASEQQPTLLGPDGLATIDVSMLDPVGRSTATGTADLVFDPAGNEICYEIGLDGVGEPADGHIHLGPSGVKGGIVVDFGPMTDGLTGCQQVPGSEIDGILADLDGHYVELHDPVEEFTVRAQLSEGTGPDGQVVAAQAGQEGDDGTDGSGGGALFDPDGGGAVAIVEPGRIVLRGEVSDRETAERALIDFAGLSDVVVVDELVITDGGPAPSGRVIIDSPGTALFATGGDALDPEAGPLVEQLVALLEARPEWLVTVVGHTDSTGNDVTNLELSFRRANAVRQELIDGGVPADRIRVRGAGSTDPLADNGTSAGRAQNRRIEFEIER